MSHFIVRVGKRDFLYHRRTHPDGVMYEARACYGSEIGEARVFTTKGAATTASKQLGKMKTRVVQVSLVEFEQ